MTALWDLERAGMIKRVTAVSARAAERALVRRASALTAAVAAAAPAPDSTDPNAGVSVVELQRDRDVPDMQVALSRDPEVEFVARVPVRYLLAIRRASRPPAGRTRRAAATPPDAASMWNLRRIKWAPARARPGFKEATSIAVGVLDTGIDDAHPDLAGRIASYTSAHPDLPRASSPQDLIGHGTHVAGTIAARINNNLGINGICRCKLRAWKIFDDVADYDEELDEFVYYVDTVMYLRALGDCIEQGIDVVNLSVGGPAAPNAQERRLFQALLDSGSVVVAAMGNERKYGSPTSYPAAIPGVIAVGATSLDDKVANFSNRGNHIWISAPGVAIWSTLPTYPGQDGFAAVPGPGASRLKASR